jgi:hypothetical protein
VQVALVGHAVVHRPAGERNHGDELPHPGVSTPLPIRTMATIG